MREKGTSCVFRNAPTLYRETSSENAECPLFSTAEFRHPRLKSGGTRRTAARMLPA